jgi:type I restriction enzyme S subunit
MSDAFPERWRCSPLRSLTSKIGYGATPRGGERAYKKMGTPLIRSMNVYCDGFRPHGLAYLDEEQASALNHVTVQAGDVLLNITGSSIGRVTQAPLAMDGARVNQHVCIIRPNKGIEASFVARYLASPSMQSLIARENYGVTRQALTKEMIENIILPVPPLDEQRRIVAKLDSLLAHSRSAREELSRVSLLTQRYKQAVLEVSMRGEDDHEWPLVQLENIVTDGPTHGYSTRSGENPSGTLSLTLAATTSGVLDLSDRAVKRLNETIPPSSKYWLRPGDILIQRSNSLEHVGAAAIYEGPEKTYIYPELMMRVRVADRNLGRWIWRYLGSAAARNYFISNARGAVGTTRGSLTINGSTVRQIMIPLPPTDRLQTCLRNLERKLVAIDRVDTQVTNAIALLDRLSQAALAKAFRGDLVPLDPKPARYRATLSSRFISLLGKNIKNWRSCF